jgi:hypothetical protein
MVTLCSTPHYGQPWKVKEMLENAKKQGKKYSELECPQCKKPINIKLLPNMPTIEGLIAAIR